MTNNPPTTQSTPQPENVLITIQVVVSKADPKSMIAEALETAAEYADKGQTDLSDPVGMFYARDI